MYQNNRFVKSLNLIVVCGFLATQFSCKTPDNRSVKQVMDNKITELYASKTESELAALDYQQAKALFSPADLKILGSRHWMFEANVPVTVSVFRSKKQEIVPWWLAENGFTKTRLSVKNEHTEYEIWQKAFPAGHVGLGIDGFENNGLHYFVAVQPQQKGDQLTLDKFFPENQYVGVLQDSAFTYHDWDELVLIGVPEELKGAQLLTTIRGRGTESHLVGAFRKTDHPSSKDPDQVMLTWSGDPSTSVDIQWRTNTTIPDGKINYRKKSDGVVHSADAGKFRLEDRLLMNDRFINRFTAKITGLEPGTVYEYQVLPDTTWKPDYTFTTAAADNDFSFTWFGDTHYSPVFGKMFNRADSSHPDAAFYTISGDLVSDGLYSDQWDKLISFAPQVIAKKPLMCVPGNHDNRYGLGAATYRAMFSYPENAPAGVPKEQTYSFTYKNTLFLMLDCTSPIEAQTSWIEEQLKNSKATWKIAMFHFPPYNFEEPYPNIQKAWIPVFDKYHVDMVLSGHTHNYMRSKPMSGGLVTDSYKKGTVYLISIAIPSHHENMTAEPYAAVRFADGQYYQYLKVEGNKFTYTALNADNKVVDSFTIKK
ncbi:purple acid phosphatase family protein [Flavihumibacter profundi]|uniref:purple acid phosphatase family protein n=1 Tax=Flavihumibacter profundi TaxID=2716883 RepID=UPI001CC65FDB|nr:metallophosphoesterase family protein [Flavihumibacter profundi]MBZ5857722.1 metallophosphoesterase family protein [Flavihumibacter profundi]